MIFERVDPGAGLKNEKWRDILSYRALVTNQDPLVLS